MSRIRALILIVQIIPLVLFLALLGFLTGHALRRAQMERVFQPSYTRIETIIPDKYKSLNWKQGYETCDGVDERSACPALRVTKDKASWPTVKDIYADFSINDDPEKSPFSHKELATIGNRTFYLRTTQYMSDTEFDLVLYEYAHEICAYKVASFCSTTKYDRLLNSLPQDLRALPWKYIGRSDCYRNDFVSCPTMRLETPDSTSELIRTTGIALGLDPTSYKEINYKDWRDYSYFAHFDTTQEGIIGITLQEDGLTAD